jgi:transposase-like protein
MTTKRKNRHYTDEFKRKAVARVAAGEKLSAIVKELKIQKSMLNGWRNKFGAEKKEDSQVKDGDDTKYQACHHLSHAIEAMNGRRIKRGRALVELALYTLTGE